MSCCWRLDKLQVLLAALSVCAALVQFTELAVVEDVRLAAVEFAAKCSNNASVMDLEAKAECVRLYVRIFSEEKELGAD